MIGNPRLSKEIPEVMSQDDWGCEYCRNERPLNDNDRCPKCDAQFDPEDE